MTYAVITSNRKLAEDTFSLIEKELTIVNKRCSVNELYMDDADGNCVRWLRLSDNCRGYRIDKAYIDIMADSETLHCIVFPMLRCSFDEIVWISDYHVTVFEYLQKLPQPLFEATLMGLMGVKVDIRTEAFFHEWMNSSASQYFGLNSSPFSRDLVLGELEKNVAGLSNDDLISSISKAFLSLQQDQQEKMKRALRDYCEVCDIINQNLADQQRKGG